MQKALKEKLKRQQLDLESRSLVELFAQEKSRVQKMTVNGAGLTLDFSKNRLNEKAFSLLIEKAQVSQLEEKRQVLFAGGISNLSEQKPALHTALRNPHNDVLPTKISQSINQALARMQQIVEKIHAQSWLGWTGKAITQVINIGTGGSYLGAQVAQTALAQYHNSNLKVQYLSNIDPENLRQVWQNLDPERSLFIIASKSFTTLEAVHNAKQVRSRLLAAGCPQNKLSQHFLGITAEVEKAQAFGLKPEHILPIWDWVGGRYSLWSAIGIPVALSTDFSHFEALLAGAKAMDEHFQNAPLEKNLPVILALLTHWYRNFWKAPTHAVIPYSYNLRHLNEYLQQLEMESNGKNLTQQGSACEHLTGSILWGGFGTNAQHSFHQLLHQGKHLIPVDFIIPMTSCPQTDSGHRRLVAEALAQAQVLMEGRSLREVQASLKQKGYSRTEIERLAKHKVLLGNRPSNILATQTLNAKTLGALLALYEHKTFVQACLWNTNPFDQWGVETGKIIGAKIDQILQQKEPTEISTNPSTAALIALYQSYQKQ